MPVFAWEGRTRQGQLKKGVVEAATEAAAMMQLRAQAIIPVSVKPKAARSGGGFNLFKRGVKTRELVVFTRQFATMIDAGLPLVQCLDIQAEQQENKSFGETLGRVKNDVEQGSTFAESLAQAPARLRRAVREPGDRRRDRRRARHDPEPALPPTSRRPTA